MEIWSSSRPSLCQSNVWYIKGKGERQRDRSNRLGGPVPSISYTECRVSPKCRAEVNTHTNTHTQTHVTHVHKAAGKSSSATPRAQPSDWGWWNWVFCALRLWGSSDQMMQSRCVQVMNGGDTCCFIHKQERSAGEVAQCRHEVPRCPGHLGDFYT